MFHQLLVKSIINQIHGYNIIEEVGDAKYQVVVKDKESVIHDIPCALLVDQPSNGASTKCKCAGCYLVTDVMNPIA